jgi:F-type H+-transporting ATPase subunit a
MRLVKIIVIFLLFGLSPIAARCADITNVPAADAANAPVAEQGAAPKAEEGVTPAAINLTHVGSFPISNSMVVSWIVALGLIIFAQVATRNIQQIPSGAQNFWEWLVESLYNFLEGIIGHALVQRTFWFFATIFIFILFSNWFGLLPVMGSIGWGHDTPNGFHLDHPLFRGVNADLNMTMAMALIFFACWIFWALQSNGPIGFLKHLFAPKGETTGALKLLMVVVFFAVGFLEIFSILFRPISLSFRLYGNIYAGENMMDAMLNLVPSLGWLLPVPFYFMELLVGVVQAMVFMLLTAVFTMLIMPHDEAHAEAHH